jgi:type I site-specific restriction endonuclease
MREHASCCGLYDTGLVALLNLMADENDDDLKPEQRARRKIDRLLAAAGWKVQNKDTINLAAGHGIAVREFTTDKGPADYGL